MPPLIAALIRQLKQIPPSVVALTGLDATATAIVFFTFRIYAAVVPYSTFPASGCR